LSTWVYKSPLIVEFSVSFSYNQVSIEKEKMQITLRKANAIQASINELIKETTPVGSLELDEFMPIEETLSSARAQFAERVALRKRLLDALYEIRKSVSRTNAVMQIDDLLADLARLEREIEFNSTLAQLNAGFNIDVIQAKVKKIAGNSESSFYSPKTVSTTVFTEEEIDNYRKTVKTLKREKQKLQDKLLELNVQATITLSDDAAKVLNEQGIL